MFNQFNFKQFMKKKNVMNDLWNYLAREAEDIKDAVLSKVPEKQEHKAEKLLTEYIFDVRYMLIEEIAKLNRSKNPYIKLINEELAKRNIFINSTFIHISIPSKEEYGKED